MNEHGAISNKELDEALDNRMQYFIQIYGSKEKLEESSGKTIGQIREEFRETIKAQMTIEK